MCSIVLCLGIIMSCMRFTCELLQKRENELLRQQVSLLEARVVELKTRLRNKGMVASTGVTTAPTSSALPVSTSPVAHDDDAQAIPAHRPARPVSATVRRTPSVGNIIVQPLKPLTGVENASAGLSNLTSTIRTVDATLKSARTWAEMRSGSSTSMFHKEPLTKFESGSAFRHGSRRSQVGGTRLARK